MKAKHYKDLYPYVRFQCVCVCVCVVADTQKENHVYEGNKYYGKMKVEQRMVWDVGCNLK